MTREEALELIGPLLAGLSSVNLARGLRSYLDPATPAEERDAVGMFWGEYIAEARKRVGAEAQATSDAEWAAFKAKHGLHDGMTEAEIDAVYDAMTDEEFERESPRGEVWHLIEALEKTTK